MCIHERMYSRKNDFIEVSDNVISYRSENNFGRSLK